jgi:hypothetical protein
MNNMIRVQRYAFWGSAQIIERFFKHSMLTVSETLKVSELQMPASFIDFK